MSATIFIKVNLCVDMSLFCITTNVYLIIGMDG